MINAKNQAFENKGVMLSEFKDGVLTLRDGKNAECSSEFIENKGAKEVVLRS